MRSVMVSAVVVISPPRSCDCLMCDFPSPPKSKELLASMTLERCRLDPRHGRSSRAAPSSSPMRTSFP